MKSSIFIILFSWICWIFTSQQILAKNSITGSESIDIDELDEEIIISSIVNYDKLSFYEELHDLSHNRVLLVDFYVPWCGFCKKLYKELQDIENILKRKNDFDIHIRRIDLSVNENKDLKTLEDITGYPTLNIYYHGSKLSTYKGTRNSSYILDYVNRKISSLSSQRIIQIKEIPQLIERMNPNSELISLVDSIEIDIKTGLETNNIEYFSSEVMAVIIGFFSPAAINSGYGLVDGKLIKTMQDLSKSFDIAVFRYCDDNDILRHFQIEDDTLFVFNSIDNYQYKQTQTTYEPFIRNFPKFSKIDLSKVQDSDDRNDIYDITSFTQEILKSMVPTALHYSKSIQPMLRLIPIRVHVLVFHNSELNPDDEIINNILSNILDISSSFVGELLFLFVEQSDFGLTQYFGITAEEQHAILSLPQIVIADMRDPNNMNKYKFQDYKVLETSCSSNSLEQCLSDPNTNNWSNYHSASITNRDDILSFIKAFIHGDLLPSYDSETIEQIESLNKNIGYNIATIIENLSSNQLINKLFYDNSNMDYLVYFHAPWCAYCKSIEPVMEKLARYFIIPGSSEDIINDDGKIISTLGQVKDVIVYRINGDKNEINIKDITLNIHGFPTLYYFPRNDRLHPVEYKGEIIYEQILAFINNELPSDII